MNAKDESGFLKVARRYDNVGSVEWRAPLGRSVKVVQVFLTTTTPRVMVFVEDGEGRKPASIFIDELEECIRLAQGKNKLEEKEKMV